MRAYLDLLDKVLNKGAKKPDRTGVGTLSLFGHQMRFDLQKGFPLLTTKKIHLKSIIYELLWFLKGDTNVRYLQTHGVRIWNEWADPKTGDLGPIYGAQWRKWKTAKGKTIDQLAQVITEIKTHPHSRRLLVSSWNVGALPLMRLYPCHVLFQFYVLNGNLSCQLYQRSADVFLGVPFNIASYSLLTMMIAQVTGLKPCELIHVTGDTHLYLNHIDQAKLQMQREPRTPPVLEINPSVCSIDDFQYEDFKLKSYDPHPRISAEVAI